MKFTGALVISLLFITSCVDHGPLRIFVTEETHVGNFATDPKLKGTTAIEKADHFCAISKSRPNGARYKALLVDGVERDAISFTNWVLKPNRVYYRGKTNDRIGRTSSTGVLVALFTLLENSIAEPLPANDPSYPGYVWTGIGDPETFAAGDTCNSWTDHSTVTTGELDIFAEKSGSAFTIPQSGANACSNLRRIYCVGQ